jgi:hypothetical protein
MRNVKPQNGIKLKYNVCGFSNENNKVINAVGSHCFFADIDFVIFVIKGIKKFS